MTRKRFARQASIGLKRLGTYERHDLLHPVIKASGEAEYTQEDLLTVRYIKRAQALGFTTEEIREILGLRDTEQSGGMCIEDRAQHWIYRIDDRIDLLLTLRAKLEHLIDAVAQDESLPLFGEAPASHLRRRSRSAAAPPVHADENPRP